MPREIWSIKPEIRKLGKNKKFIAGRTTVKEPTVKEPEEIQFHYDTSEFDTFEKEGFQPPQSNERFDIKEREFLKRVTLDYDKVMVKILSMHRQKAVEEILWKSAPVNKDNIVYTIKFAPEDCTFGNRMATRDQFSYEQFATWKWEDVYKWHIKPTVKAAMEFIDKNKTGYNLTYEPS